MIKFPTGHVVDYDYEDVVYIRSDVDQIPRIVIGYVLKSGDSVKYILSLGASGEGEFMGIEISKNKNLML